MANFLYNGVELPDINTVWTDKETYQYAYIARYNGTYGSATELWVSSEPLVHRTADSDYRVEGLIVMYTLDTDTGVWGNPWSTNDGTSINGSTYTWFYCSSNILNDDGSLYLAASAPLRVDSKLQISVGGGANGDGYALYNGVKLPNIDSVWTDKETYPYAYISGFDGQYLLYFVGELPTIDGTSVLWETGTALCAYGCVTGDLSWTFYGEMASDGSSGALENFGCIWTSGDILNADNTVYLAASDPIPLDGHTVIEWDGNTEGLEVVDDVLYKVSDYFAQPLSAYSVLNMDGVLDVGNIIGYPDTNSFGWMVGSDVVTDPVVAFYDYYDVPDGLYFINDGSVYTTLFAHRSTSSGSITATTATVNFTCTDLENTEATDSIKAWVYKQSDGLSIAVEPTWTSELFGAPSYSASHTFTGLSPNTEYEVYGCIFVDGEATDHNALAAFTTLEASGDLKPVYKRVNGAWVKQTAYERVNCEWVLISSAEEVQETATMLYNGVELPNINTVWTDKETYPYAVMTAFDASVYDMTGYLYSLNLLTAESYMDSNKLMLPAGGRGTVYWLATDEGLAGDLGISVVNEWSLGDDEFGSDDVAIQCNIYEEPPIWSNHDIINTTDNTVYLAASAPVPV